MQHAFNTDVCKIKNELIPDMTHTMMTVYIACTCKKVINFQWITFTHFLSLYFRCVYKLGCAFSGFTTMTQCKKECVCRQPISEGSQVGGPNCEQEIMRWMAVGEVCVQKPYTGCGGNGNNFVTQAECQNACNPRELESMMGFDMPSFNEMPFALPPGSFGSGMAHPGLPPVGMHGPPPARPNNSPSNMGKKRARPNGNARKGGNRAPNTRKPPPPRNNNRPPPPHGNGPPNQRRPNGPPNSGWHPPPPHGNGPPPPQGPQDFPPHGNGQRGPPPPGNMQRGPPPPQRHGIPPPWARNGPPNIGPNGPNANPNFPPQRQPNAPPQRMPNAPPKRMPNAPPQRQPNAPPQRQPNAPPQYQPNEPPQYQPNAPPQRQPNYPPPQRQPNYPTPQQNSRPNFPPPQNNPTQQQRQPNNPPPQPNPQSNLPPNAPAANPSTFGAQVPPMTSPVPDYPSSTSGWSDPFSWMFY